MITHRQLMKTDRCKSSSGTKEVSGVDWRVAITGSQGTWLEACTLAPCWGAVLDNLRLVLDNHNTVPSVQLQVLLPAQQENKKVIRGGDFNNSSVMEASSERERVSVQLVTLAAPKSTRAGNSPLLWLSDHSVSSLEFTKSNFCRNPPGNKLQSISL